MYAPSAVNLPLRHTVRQLSRSASTRKQCIRTFWSRTQPNRPVSFGDLSIAAPQYDEAPTQCLGQQKQQRRQASTFVGNAKSLFRQNPVSVTLAVGAILAGIGALAYTNYLYQTYILGAFHNYPEEVATKLRRALYYTNTDLQPQEAIAYYRQALQVAEEMGMDPFSDEIIGVKVQVAGLMERVRQHGKAAQVLEILRNDSMEWMRQFGQKDHNRAKRTRILAKIVAITVKLGELYSSPEIYDRELAEERLVWAVETTLNESQRRRNLQASKHYSDEQLEVEEGKWMNPSEIGAALEALAHSYEEKDQHYLASPLFLQALSLYPTKDCHTIILMNNLSSSLAQQSPRAAAAAQAYAASRNLNEAHTQRPAAPAVTRESLIQNGAAWAQKALQVAASIQPPERNEECDVGCAVATHNLGEFAEMLGQNQEAMKRYKEAVSIAKAVGFQEGMMRSSERLKELQK